MVSTRQTLRVRGRAATDVNDPFHLARKHRAGLMATTGYLHLPRHNMSPYFPHHVRLRSSRLLRQKTPLLLISSTGNDRFGRRNAQIYDRYFRET